MSSFLCLSQKRSRIVTTIRNLEAAVLSLPGVRSKLALELANLLIQL